MTRFKNFLIKILISKKLIKKLFFNSTLKTLRNYIDEDSFFILINQLLKEKNYYDVVVLFCKYLNNYTAKRPDKEQIVPHSHLDLVTIALLNLVKIYIRLNFILRTTTPRQGLDLMNYLLMNYWF